MESKPALASLTALAHETRLAIFRLLVEAGPTGESAGEIAAAVNAAPPTLSFHLKELVHAGLIVPRQEGRFIFYAANFERMNELVAFLTANCCARDGATCAPVSNTAPDSATSPLPNTLARARRRRGAAR